MNSQEQSPYAAFKARYTEIPQPPQEKQLTPEQIAQLDAFNKEINDATPTGSWGEVSGTSAFGPFRNEFYQRLEAGNSVDEYARQYIADHGLEAVYIIRAQNETSSKVWQNNQPESLAATRAKLEAAKAHIPEALAGIPDFIKEEYAAKIDSELRYCEASAALGTPEFTRVHRSPEDWSALLDPESLTGDEIKMRYEDEALAILEISKVTETPELDFKSVEEALKKFNITEVEMLNFGFTPEELQGQTVPAEKLRNFFRYCSKRSEALNQWNFDLDTGTTAVDVDAKSRKVAFPPEERFHSEDQVYLPYHEYVHVIGGENGSHQPVGTLWTGMNNYLATEEGKAVLAEMIAGQKFGNPRQFKMAARYYAVALALKTETNEQGERVAKYSMQDIYNILVDYNIAPEDSWQTVWRTFRGTSLQRKVVDITTPEGATVPVGEVFTKDQVYFEGQMMMFEEFMDILPLSAVDKERLKKVETRDLSSHLLYRVGRQAFLGGEGTEIAALSSQNKDSDTMKLKYEALVALGTERLFELLEYLLVGKINVKTVKEHPEWNDILVRDPATLVKYRDVVLGPGARVSQN